MVSAAADLGEVHEGCEEGFVVGVEILVRAAEEVCILWDGHGCERLLRCEQLMRTWEGCFLSWDSPALSVVSGSRLLRMLSLPSMHPIDYRSLPVCLELVASLSHDTFFEALFEAQRSLGTWCR